MTKQSKNNLNDQTEDNAVDNKIRPIDSVEGGDELLIQYDAVMGGSSIGTDERPTRLFANWLRAASYEVERPFDR